MLIYIHEALVPHPMLPSRPHRRPPNGACGLLRPSQCKQQGCCNCCAVVVGWFTSNAMQCTTRILGVNTKAFSGFVGGLEGTCVGSAIHLTKATPSRLQNMCKRIMRPMGPMGCVRCVGCPWAAWGAWGPGYISIYIYIYIYIKHLILYHEYFAF